MTEEGNDTLDERWVFHENTGPVQAGPGTIRKILAHSKDLMYVGNTSEERAVGSLHHHPHTQTTYMVSREFESSIGDEKGAVRVRDTMLKLDGVEYGCMCGKTGILLDIFNPIREDFVQVNQRNILCSMLKNS